MRPHWLAALALAAAAILPVAAEPPARSYRLTELQAIARATHPTLASAEAALAAASAAAVDSRAWPNPSVTVALGRGEPRGGGGANRSEHTVELVQPIERPGLRRWRARAAELGLRVIEAEHAATQAALDAAVSELVVSILVERRRAAIARESADVASRLHDLLARRVEVGESSRLEALAARSEWFARRREVLEASSALEGARAALDALCDDRLPEGYEVAETLEGPGAIALPGDLAERLRAGHPLLRRAGFAIDEAQARAIVARREVLPRVDALAGHETELDRTAASVGLGLTVPLWNRQRGAIAAAAAERDRAAADREGLARELEIALERASAAYGGALAELALHADGWTETARGVLDVATFSFENGEVSLLGVLDAQRSYLGVRRAEAEAWAELALARAEIERLIAGPLVTEGER